MRTLKILSLSWKRAAIYLYVANYPAQQNRSKMNWGNQSGRTSFVRLKTSHLRFDIVQNL